MVRLFKLLFGLGEAETNFTPSPYKILAIAILLGFCFLAIVTILIIIMDAKIREEKLIEAKYV